MDVNGQVIGITHRDHMVLSKYGYLSMWISHPRSIFPVLDPQVIISNKGHWWGNDVSDNLKRNRNKREMESRLSDNGAISSKRLF